MTKLVEKHHAEGSYLSYVIGFVLSVITTLAAYLLVVNDVLPQEILMYTVVAIALIQLFVQLVFFLHLGKKNRWKLVTFLFAFLVVLIVVVGSLWIMHNLDYNMMTMPPEQIEQYMKANEGI